MSSLVHGSNQTVPLWPHHRAVFRKINRHLTSKDLWHGNNSTSSSLVRHAPCHLCSVFKAESVFHGGVFLPLSPSSHSSQSTRLFWRPRTLHKAFTAPACWMHLPLSVCLSVCVCVWICACWCDTQLSLFDTSSPWLQIKNTCTVSPEGARRRAADWQHWKQRQRGRGRAVRGKKDQPRRRKHGRVRWCLHREVNDGWRVENKEKMWSVS